MKLRDYQINTLLTANKLPHNEGLQNWALGLCGEAGEFCAVYKGIEESDEGITAEAGDVTYYASMTANQAGINLEDVPTPNHFVVLGEDRLLLELWVASAKVSEAVKKHLYHGKQLNINALALNLARVLFSLDLLLKLRGSSLSDAMGQNKAKLEKRHPNGFEPQHAHAPY